MKIKHTPGPWEQRDGDFVFVEGDISKLICDIRGWGWLQQMGYEEAGKVRIANAKLIAAAPEMFEALRLAKEEIEACYLSLGKKDLSSPVLTYIHELIKKVL